MEISKEKLMSIISESSIEMDEMGRIWDKADAISRPIKDDEGNLIGHDMLIDPNNPQSGRVNVIFTCDIQEFVNNHPDLVAKLKTQYGNVKWSSDTCPKYNPHRNTKRVYSNLPDDEENDSDIERRPYQASGETYDVQENIRRIFNPILREEFGLESDKGKQFNEVLSKRSIPAIIVNDPKFEDRHTDVWNNSEIKYKVHSFNTYENAQAFLKSVVARIAGKNTEENSTTYLARQFNQRYSNWEETRKNDKRYEGKTSVFQLDKRGFSELNLDVSMKMEFGITGIRENNEFVWKITMKNKFGRKRPDEYRISNGGLKPITLQDGGYLDEGLITIEKRVQLENTDNDQFTEDKSIMSDFAVSEGLRQAIADFKAKIEGISPKSALKYANVKRSDIEKVNESVVKLSLDILNQIKK
jgi:hypothetical protein